MDRPDPDLSRAHWRTSTFSNDGGACVEVATNLPAIIAVRDSKAPGNQPVLTFAPTGWAAFLNNVTNGELDSL